MSQPQPPYYPPQPAPHSHDKFIAAIIIAVVITAIVAGGIGYGLGSLARSFGTSPLTQASVTPVHGKVTLPSGQIPYFIIFNDTSSGGSVSSSVTNYGDTYQASLKTDHTYVVTVEYQRTGSYSNSYYKGCTPSPITPVGSDFAMDFLC
jgi:hypothetical protein